MSEAMEKASAAQAQLSMLMQTKSESTRTGQVLRQAFDAIESLKEELAAATAPQSDAPPAEVES